MTTYRRTKDGLILPEEYARKYKDPKDNDAKWWYVVKSYTDAWSLQVGEDLKPMFYAKTMDECKWYVAQQMEKDKAMGYDLFDVNTDYGYIIILRYELAGGLRNLMPNNANLFIIYGIFSDKQAQATYLTHRDE